MVERSVRAARHSRRAAAALLRLGESDPAFASLSLWCRHRDAPAPPAAQDDALEPPAWTDGRAIFYGPAFERLDADEQMGAAAHQILHIAFRHAQRARAMALRLGDGFAEDLFGLAADAIVNETLVLAGRPPPRPCPLLSELLEQALAETTPPAQAVAAWDVERLYLALTGAAGGRARRGGRNGDGAGDGAAEAARAYAARRGYAPDLRSEEAIPDDAAAEAEIEDDAEWRQRLARALEAGRLSGEGLGAPSLRLGDLPEPRTPWETLLRRMVMKETLKPPRVSWTRPTRRWTAADARARATGDPAPGFEPGLRRPPDTPRIAMAVDASASISDALLRRFAAEICGAGRRTGAAIHLLVFDVAVRASLRLSPGRWEEEIGAVDFTRGGGTSFIPVMEAAAALDPSIIVVLSDLDGPIGPRPGARPVLWATPESRSWIEPPFGAVISLER
ncbi:MAG: VWA-like domain-containing protein [Pseudomonadota bacterium]